MREYSVLHHSPHHLATWGQQDEISMLGGWHLASNLWGSSKLFCSKLLGGNTTCMCICTAICTCAGDVYM
jgi:hypothetical protein